MTVTDIYTGKSRSTLDTGKMYIIVRNFLVNELNFEDKIVRSTVLGKQYHRRKTIK